MFSWVPIHKEAAGKLMEFRNRQAELVALLTDMDRQGLTVIGLKDKAPGGRDIALAEIDPFTFFASFNRKITDEKRRKNWAYLKAAWNLSAAVPEDFHGIPIMHPMKSWFMPYSLDRQPDHVDLLWQLAAQTVGAPEAELDASLFDRCIGLTNVSTNNLTMGLFWLNPGTFISADGKNIEYGAAYDIDVVPKDCATYIEWLQEMTATFGNDYPATSQAAHLYVTEPVPGSRRYWVMALGRNAEYWDECHAQGIAVMGWSNLGDLVEFVDKEALRHRLLEVYQGDTSKKNDALACWQFAKDVKPGDIVFAKRGVSVLLGYGVVTGDYEFDPTRPQYKHTRRVGWKSHGEWSLPGSSQFPLKTLTDITRYQGLVKTLSELAGLDDENSNKTSYWWLNANPEMWDLDATDVGEKQTYTSHNEKGNKRQKYKYLQEVAPGDVVIGYVTTPRKEVVAICRITKGLHQAPEGERIEFEKMERLATPLQYADLKAHPGLKKCEPLIGNQGSLLGVTPAEFEIIRSLIDETPPPIPAHTPFTMQMAMEGLFMSQTQFDDMLSGLKERKNIVIQGAPGVGKSFVAKRLAFALTEVAGSDQVEMIQFHQSYSYEDFIQGFKPTPDGTFELRLGVFHRFCRRAQREESKGTPFVFIIDEINRGNLGKIFGELMLLIEADKRGKSHAIPLAYSDDATERFYIPENLHFIGTMNTADRSLALVDYALRRRFRFVTLKPEFASQGFRSWLSARGVGDQLIQKIVSRITLLNEGIGKDRRSLGPGYEIGHSYFCPATSTAGDDNWYRRIVQSEIVPLLEEYWFDDADKVEQARAMLLA